MRCNLIALLHCCTLFIVVALYDKNERDLLCFTPLLLAFYFCREVIELTMQKVCLDMENDIFYSFKGLNNIYLL